MKPFILLRKSHLPPDMIGWGNGYVAISEGHPWYKQDYNAIDADVHGGLTFAKLESPSKENANYETPDGSPIPEGEYWVVGFDTAHLEENIAKQPSVLIDREIVKEAEELVLN